MGEWPQHHVHRDLIWTGDCTLHAATEHNAFHGVIPCHLVYPLEQITLHVTFDDHSNFRTEWLQFEVMDFLGSYKAILEKSCYAKFMVVPNYTYLKLKMSRPRRIITASASIKTAPLPLRQRTPVSEQTVSTLQRWSISKSPSPRTMMVRRAHQPMPRTSPNAHGSEHNQTQGRRGKARARVLSKQAL
jgi:hypothetical protein